MSSTEHEAAVRYARAAGTLEGVLRNLLTELRVEIDVAAMRAHAGAPDVDALLTTLNVIEERYRKRLAELEDV